MRIRLPLSSPALNIRSPQSESYFRLRLGGFLRRVRRETVAERPVLLLDLDEIDEHVLRAHAQLALQALGEGLVEEAFLFQAATFGQGDLDGDKAVGAWDVHVAPVEHERVARVLG